MNKKFSIQKLVFLALFVALNVVFTRFLAVQSPIARFNFGFLPIAVSAVMFGPLFGGIVGTVADITGMLVNGVGTYFPLFTLNAFLYGVTFGMFLYKKERSFKNIALCVTLQTIVINLFLTSVWLYILNNFITDSPIGFLTILAQRVVTALVIIPVEIITIDCVCKYLMPEIEKITALRN